MRTITTTFALAAVAALAGPATGAVRVVASNPTLADIAHQVGGDHVDVESIMRGPENPHNVIPKPSFVIKLRRADLFVHMGLDGEMWTNELVKATRQARLHPGGEANVDASRGVRILEIPERGEMTRALGDIHVLGNPHYTLDPLNGIVIARTIADALQVKDPAHRDDYEANYDDFATRIRALTDRLVAAMRPYAGTEVVTYHRVWPYFFERFGLVNAAEIEPKPGIAPGPKHLGEVVESMKRRDIRVAVVETFNSFANTETVATRAGGKAVVLATEVNAVPEATSYEALFEHDVRTLLDAFAAVGVAPKESGGAAAAPTGFDPTP